MPSSDDNRPPADLAITTMQLARAVRGDDASISWVVQHLSPALRAYASYRLGSVLRRHYDPDDLLHDAWLAALPKLETLLGSNERRRTPVLLRYLSQTIVYRIQGLARRHARRMPPEATQVSPSQLPASVHGTLTRVLRQELQDEVRRHLDDLDERDREILLLRGIEQLSAKATATLLGIGVEATHKRYQRALTRLRDKLPQSIFAELGDDPDAPSVENV